MQRPLSDRCLQKYATNDHKPNGDFIQLADPVSLAQNVPRTLSIEAASVQLTMNLPMQDEHPEGNSEKDPDDWVNLDQKKTGAESSYLQTLCEDAAELIDFDLSNAEVSKPVRKIRFALTSCTLTLIPLYFSELGYERA